TWRSTPRRPVAARRLCQVEPGALTPAKPRFAGDVHSSDLSLRRSEPERVSNGGRDCEARIGEQPLDFELGYNPLLGAEGNHNPTCEPGESPACFAPHREVLRRRVRDARRLEMHALGGQA